MNQVSFAFDLGELKARIKALDGNTWLVERTLKSTPYEETQVVRRNGSDAGPFIRKLFAEDADRGDVYEELFRAQSAGRNLTHIPRIYDCTRSNDGLAVVMEYIPGETLRQRVGREGGQARIAWEVAPGLCEALSELHTALDAPLIHRDVKPGNIILGRSGVMLIDLGIARTWSTGAERDTTHFGTPGYAPPEQYGFGQTGVAGDIYAAGMTLAYCCTGEDPTGSLREKGFADPRIPDNLRTVIVKATQLDPAARFQSAAEMKEAIDLALEGRRLENPSIQGSGQAPYPPNRPMTNADLESGKASVRDARQATSANPLKYLWNGLIIALYLWLVLVLARAFFTAITSSSDATLQTLSTNPALLALVAVDILLVFLAVTAVAYLLLFKVHLRRFTPFSRYTWRQELPVGIGFLVFCYVFLTLSTPLAHWLQ